MKRWILRIGLALIGLLLLVTVTGILVLRSQWFLEQLRTRIVAVAENATGGKVELGSLGFDWRSMHATATQFVLHGKETEGEAPLIQVEAVDLGLRIISVFERQVDLQSLRISKPRVNIIVYPDGTTNFPGAANRPERLWSEDLLNLKIGEYQITQGWLNYDHRGTPFTARGENLEIRLTYDRTTPAYGGEITSDGVTVTPPGYAPIDGSLNAQVRLERDVLKFTRLEWRSPLGTAELKGDLQDMRHPHGTLEVQARTTMRELVREFRWPIDPSGSAAFQGQLQVSFEDGFDYAATGTVSAQGLRYVKERVRIENASMRGNVTVDRNSALVRNLRVRALDATVEGELRLDEWRDLRFRGTMADLNLRRALNLVTDRMAPWDGTLSGPLDLRTTLNGQDSVVQTTLTIVPAADAEPINGHFDVTYDQQTETLALGSSSFATAQTRVELQGTLGQTLRVRGQTTKLEDLRPAIAFARGDGAPDLPLRLNNGSIVVDGMVTGRLADPQFRGQVSVVNGEVMEQRFDRFSGEVAANQREVIARKLTVARGATTATGDVALTFRQGSRGIISNSEVIAELALRNVDVAEVTKLAGISGQVTGTATAAVRLTGSLEQPNATGTVDIANPRANGEVFDRVRASVQYSPGRLAITDGVATDRGAEVRFAGTFEHPRDDWRNGRVSFQASSPNLPTARIERMAQVRPAVSTVLSGDVRGSGEVAGGTFTLTTATANTTARQITVNGQPIGDLAVQAETKDNTLNVTARGNVRDTRVDGSGSWRLEGDAPGSATVRFTRVSVDTLHDLVMLERSSEPPSVVGFVEGEANIRVALRKPEDVLAEVRLATVQVSPRQEPPERLGLSSNDLTLRNSQPVVLEVSSRQAAVRSARFTARDSQMDVTGTIPFATGAGADLNVKGNIDLVILQLLRPDLQAEGDAAVNANVRGSLQDPNINGELTLRGASLYLEDIPNGVDNATGRVSFNRRRATIENVTAEVGGGQVTLSGYLDFGTTMVYGLRANARNIRVRYPRDVSTTFNAALELKGTSEASTLTGNVDLTRMSISIGTDLAAFLGEADLPQATLDTDNEYLSGMRLQLRIQNGTGFQLDTSNSSLASNIEADVDLQLQGTPSRPVLQGNITINRGEMQVNGNRFTVDRGEIRFLNRVRIEPAIDMDLSTRARGVTVNISLSGTMQQLNANYSSDPPLQTSEIFALLSVGRDPTSTVGQLAPGANAGAGASSLFMQAGGNLIGQAVTAQVNNRLQRFFGASRIKIDPTLTGVDNLPQARLTLEQQVSKDITLTYITNLNRTQEQVVRLQWDFSREWSAIAVRDANGVFSLDFQLRKRFK